MNMFDIYYADLSSNKSSEQGGTRPVVVVQNNIGNKFSPTLIVLPITSEIKKEWLPTHCIIHKSENNGLKVDSMVLAEQIRVIDKSRLIDKIGHLDNEEEQGEVINTYIANVTGKKNNNNRIINIILKIIRKGIHNAA